MGFIKHRQSLWNIRQLGRASRREMRMIARTDARLKARASLPTTWLGRTEVRAGQVASVVGAIVTVAEAITVLRRLIRPEPQVPDQSQG